MCTGHGLRLVAIVTVRILELEYGGMVTESKDVYGTLSEPAAGRAWVRKPQAPTTLKSERLHGFSSPTAQILYREIRRSVSGLRVRRV